MWCIPTVNAEYVARMEDVLALYAAPPDPQRPVVCFDETPRQLIGEARVPIPAQAGKPRRVDYEYVRHGTANVFVFVDVHRPWRHAKVTDHRASVDFADCMRDLVDDHYPTAARIRVVLDNLSTHSPAALYQAFGPGPTDSQRLEFRPRRNTPAQPDGRDRNASWSSSACPGIAETTLWRRSRRGSTSATPSRPAFGGVTATGARETRPYAAPNQSRHGRRVNRQNHTGQSAGPMIDSNPR